MALKTGMLVGVVGTGDMGVLIQIREASQTCVIKLNSGALKKNVPLADVEEARDMTDTKEHKSPIRLEATAAASPSRPQGASPPKSAPKPGSPAQLAPLAVGDSASPRSKPKATTATVFEAGDKVKARHWKTGDRWTAARVTRVRTDGTVDLEFDDGQAATRVPAADVEARDAASARSKATLSSSSLSPKKTDAPPTKSAAFEVGQAVRARYKKGKRFFPGIISAVNADGTFNVKYEDGDAETRVAESLIEAVGTASPKKAALGQASDAFCVGQSVRARCMEGSRWFPGTIKRVHADGTLDVLYDDGDVETRVRRDLVESTEAQSDAPHKTRAESKPGSAAAELSVGDAVKARYKKGSKIFSGVITKVRTDDTFDIRYDDGDVEMRVVRDMIERVDGDGRGSDAKPSAGDKRPSGFQVGDRVQAFFKGGRSLFAGKITKKNSNGTYDIDYDDGDSEQRVPADLIQPIGSPDKLEADKRPSSATIKRVGFSKGDKVRARYKGGAKFFAGTITRLRADGTYDIEFDDGDAETRVEASRIEAVDGDKQEGLSPKRDTTSAKYEVGDAVKARYKNGKKLFSGKIVKVHRDGTYDIAYDDGDAETRVPADRIEGGPTPKPSKSDEDAFQAGDRVQRTRKGKRLTAVIHRVRRDGTYDIKYDDGELETEVEADLLKREASKASGPPKLKRLKVGDKVRARFKGGSKLFNGRIVLARTDGTFDIDYDDGDSEKRVQAEYIEAVDAPNSDKVGYEVGQSVQAYYKGGKKLFSGKISRVHSDGTYDIKYDDGDSETRILSSQIVTDQAERLAERFEVGDKVKAQFKGGDKFFLGKVTRVHANGTCDIKYDDGDSETRVDPGSMIALGHDGSLKHKDVEPTESPRRLEVGDAVNARYKGGTKKFFGTITCIRSNGTYDVKYQDGDVETGVRAALIELQQSATSTSTTAGQPGGKSRGLEVGTKVRARYQQGSRWFSGKITKLRSDDTFDVRYDDGDKEQRVRKEFIEMANEDATDKAKSTEKDDDDLFGDDDSGDDARSGKPKPAKTALKKGVVVEANFKRKGKFHRGKIVRVHSDGSCDIEYDAGASEKCVDPGMIRKLSPAGDDGSDSDGRAASTKQRVPERPGAKDSSSTADDGDREQKSSSPKQPTSDVEPSSSKLQPGMRVTHRKASDARSRRVGIVNRLHRDGSCDVVYADGETSKRIDPTLLLVCSDSEGSSDEAAPAAAKHSNKRQETPKFQRHERVLSNWRRPNKFATPRQTSELRKATILAINSDNTYTIRYEDGTTEDDAPPNSLKAQKKHKQHHNSDADSSGSEHSSVPRKRRKRHRASAQVSTETLYLLKQLALTLLEEGEMTKRGLAGRSNSSDSSSSDDSSSSSSSETDSPTTTGAIEKIVRKLFDSRLLLGYRTLFKEQDSKGTGKISRSRIVAVVVKLCNPKKASGTIGSDLAQPSPGGEDSSNGVVEQSLSEWFDSHDDLRTHKRFDFFTCLLAFAVAKHRLGKLRVEQAVASALDGRFASQLEYRRQLQLWQQKLGFRVFETLQRLFHEQAMPNIIPSRVRVSSLRGIFDSAVRSAVPSKPLEVYLQQLGLFPHQTLLFPEFLCCYYQLYGSTADSTHPVTETQTLELRPIAFVASCMFANGDAACQRHGDLVRRLCVGRTPSQQDLILKFREVFESLLNISERQHGEHQLLPTAQLAAFASKVSSDPTLMAPAIAALCKRSAAVSFVEVMASCGFVIDELTTAPTLTNAIEMMRIRTDVAEVRRIIGLVRNLCLKILRFPNNSDYWRIRADTDSFQRKIGRFDGATCVLEAAGFVEYKSTHFELRGARAVNGKRVSALSRETLDRLRESCVHLDAELAMLDGVDSITAVIERVAEERARQSSHFSLDECRAVLQHLLSCIENVLKNPKDSRPWRIRQVNPTFERQIGYLPFAADLMEAIGYDLVESTQGNVFVLRGTSPIADQSSEKVAVQTQKMAATRPASTASLSNFAFSSVSGQMEWFLWRRKQEIDSLLQGELQYYFGQPPSAAEAPRKQFAIARSPSRAIADIVKVYPYGTNAIDTFNKTTVQQRQLEMMRACFDNMDRAARGYLTESDFAQQFPQWVDGPPWLRFDAFDVGCDGKLDFPDFVAALGPLLDHQFELEPAKKSKTAIVTGDNSRMTLCEAISKAVGDLRLSMRVSESSKVLELLLTHLHRLLEEPSNEQFWRVEPRSVLGNYLERLAPVRDLLRIGGFRSMTSPPKLVDTSDSSAECGSVGVFELTPQRVRFTTSGQGGPQSKPPGLDTAVIASLQSTAAIVAGHFRGLKFPTVSDVGAVARALEGGDRLPQGWVDLAELVFRCVSNIVDHPEEERYRQLRTSTETYRKVVASVQGGESMLLSTGFRETDLEVLVLPFDTSLDELQARHLEFAVGICLLRRVSRPAARSNQGNDKPQQCEATQGELGPEKRASSSSNRTMIVAARRGVGQRPVRTTPRNGAKRA